MEIVALAKELFDGKEVRIFGTWEKPLFVANDIGKLLGLTNIRKTMSNYDHTKKVIAKGPTLGGDQTMTYLTIKGLYSVSFTARKGTAIKFQDWVFNVIEKIRLEGRYDMREDIKKQQSNSENLQSKNKNGLDKKVPLKNKSLTIYHKYDINDFNKKPTVYLFHLQNNDYKFAWLVLPTIFCGFEDNFNVDVELFKHIVDNMELYVDDREEYKNVYEKVKKCLENVEKHDES